jgi:hypothetical protein
VRAAVAHDNAQAVVVLGQLEERARHLHDLGSSSTASIDIPGIRATSA